MSAIYRRFARIESDPAKHCSHPLLKLIHEVAKFGTIGTIGAIIAFGLSNLLHHAGTGPLTAFAIGSVVATLFSYYANRFWTFRHRDSAGAGREYVLFFVLSAVGLAITELIVGFTYYVLDLRGLLAYNAAMVVGTAVGTLFRFWSYKKWVFLAPVPVDPAPQPEPVSV